MEREKVETWKLKETVGIQVLSPPLMAPVEPFVGPSNIIFLRVKYISEYIYYYILCYRFRVVNTLRMMSHVVVVKTGHIRY